MMLTGSSGGRNPRPIGSHTRCGYGGSTMEPIEFPSDFTEFLKLLNANEVEQWSEDCRRNSRVIRARPTWMCEGQQRASRGRSKDLADLDNLP